jgi:hypothetical protein
MSSFPTRCKQAAARSSPIFPRFPLRLFQHLSEPAAAAATAHRGIMDDRTTNIAVGLGWVGGGGGGGGGGIAAAMWGGRRHRQPTYLPAVRFASLRCIVLLPSANSQPASQPASTPPPRAHSCAHSYLEVDAKKCGTMISGGVNLFFLSDIHTLHTALFLFVSDSIQPQRRTLPVAAAAAAPRCTMACLLGHHRVIRQS